MMSFGLYEVENSHLEELYISQGAMRPVVTQMVTRKAYHRDRDICQHATDDPLDLVRLHPKEDIIEGGPRRTWQRKFINYRINQLTGLNIIEFFELAYDDAAFMIEMAKSANTQEDLTASALMRGLKV